MIYHCESAKQSYKHAHMANKDRPFGKSHISESPGTPYNVRAGKSYRPAVILRSFIALSKNKREIVGSSEWVKHWTAVWRSQLNC